MPDDIAAARPAPSPLPPNRGSDPLTPDQWRILSALADTVVPAFNPAQGNRLLQHPLSADVYQAAQQRIQRLAGAADDHGLIAAYLGESVSVLPGFRNAMIEVLDCRLHSEARNGLLFILKALNTRVGALVLTGHTTPLDCLPMNVREQILQGWATARLPLLRGLHRSFTALFTIQWLRESPTVGRVLAYPGTLSHGEPVNKKYPFHFVQISSAPNNHPETIETDIVVVGSGCGGAVAAKTLAEGGMKVLVVDKGYYWSPDHLPMSEAEGAAHLFAEGGAIQSDDNSIAVVAGSTWGGGGTVNWSASLQTQGFVRREWSERHGLPYFTSSQFQADLDAVCDRMGVGTAAIEHNKANRALLEGARKLGWSSKVVPQNTGGEAHACGLCTLGCGSCGKKGPTETFLPDAAEAGARFLEGFECREVLWQDNVSGEPRTAVGVKGTWTSRDGSGGVAGDDRVAREVVIKAKKVVLAGGTLLTPLILARSGLKNPQIGRNLRLHPVSMVAAVWDEDVRPWEGSILTSLVNEFENLDGRGHGAKLEATTMLPSMFLPLFPWRSALHWKEFTAKMKRMTGYISLARDRAAGRLFPDPLNARPRIDYPVAAPDRAHILHGLLALAQLLYVQGAREIHLAAPHIPPFLRPHPSTTHDNAHIEVVENPGPSTNDHAFALWLTNARALGLPAPQCGFASAHQMGTCRMGVHPGRSVVDPKGAVWGAKGLYVADASVLPSASGVNPMVTVMAVCRAVARGIVRVERREGVEMGRAKL